MDSAQVLEVLLKLGVIGQSDVKAANELLAETGNTTTKMAGAMAEGTAATGKFHSSARGLESILRVIATEAGPQAGLALSSLAFAGSGSMLLASLGVRELFDWINKLQQKADESRQTAVAMWEAQKEGSEDAAKSAEDFNAAMQKQVDASKELETALKGAQAILQAQIDGHKKLLDALEKEQMAEAAGDKAKEESVRRRFEDIKREYDLQTESMQLEQKRDDLTNRKIASQKLNTAALQAEADLQEEMDSRAAADAAGRMEGKDEKKLKADADVDTLNALKRLYAQSGTPATAEEAEAQAQLGKDIEKRQKIVDVFDAYEKDADTVRRHKDIVERLTKAKDNAVKVYNENNDAIQTETKDINTGEAVLNIHRGTVRQQNAAAAVAAAGGNTQDILTRGVADIAAYQRGQQLSQQQANEVAALRAEAEMYKGNGVALINLIKEMIAHGLTQAQIVAQLQQDLNNLKSAALRPTS